MSNPTALGKTVFSQTKVPIALLHHLNFVGQILYLRIPLVVGFTISANHLNSQQVLPNTSCWWNHHFSKRLNETMVYHQFHRYIINFICISSISWVYHQFHEYIINFIGISHQFTISLDDVHIFFLPVVHWIQPLSLPASTAVPATAPGWTRRSSSLGRRTTAQRSGDVGSPKWPAECHPPGILGWGPGVPDKASGFSQKLCISLLSLSLFLSCSFILYI